jgi:hypothetical protein
MSLKVLLLEDDESLTRELLHALGERSCEVVACADAEEGIGAAASQRFDVILLSSDFHDRIRNEPATAGVPIVVMSKPVAIADVMASLPEPPRRGASLAPSGDLRETIKNQARTVQSLRADLAARGQTIDTLTKRTKELTQRLTEAQTQLETERQDRAAAVADLRALEQKFTAELEAIEARRAAEAADRERAHAEETAFLERAHEEATEAAARRLEDSQRGFKAAQDTQSADAEAHALELAQLRDLAQTIEQARDAAVRERDEVRIQLESNAMDVAQAQMELAEETRRRATDAQTYLARIAELEKLLAEQRQQYSERVDEPESALTGTRTIQGELAAANAKVTELTRALESAEREAIQAQLARDAAFHDMNVRAAADRDAAVQAAKAEAAAEREELMRTHEHAIKIARDKAIAQTLAVARERKKQQS